MGFGQTYHREVGVAAGARLPRLIDSADANSGRERARVSARNERPVDKLAPGLQLPLLCIIINIWNSHNLLSVW